MFNMFFFGSSRSYIRIVTLVIPIFKFNALYIRPTPFLKGGCSSNFTLVPWGNIKSGLLVYAWNPAENECFCSDLEMMLLIDKFRFFPLFLAITKTKCVDFLPI